MAGSLKNMFEGFKQFVMRGNVVELAVAVVIGAAFGAVVKSFTDYVINPLLAVFGGVDAAGFGFQITSNPKTFVDVGAVISAALQFLITAAVVYFLIVAPMRKANEGVRKLATSGAQAQPEPEPEPAPEPNIVLLEEIRDLLKAGIGGATPGKDDKASPKG